LLTGRQCRKVENTPKRKEEKENDMNTVQNSRNTMQPRKPLHWLRFLKTVTAAAVLTATVGMAGTALAAVVSDYSMIVGDSSVQIGDALPVWTATFNTGGRETSNAFLTLNVANLTATSSAVAVRINGTIVGYIYPYTGAPSTHWYSQTIAFSGSVLHNGSNEIEVRAVSYPGASYGDIYDDFFLKGVICHFKQDV
jgi:hypothetical protein